MGKRKTPATEEEGKSSPVEEKDSTTGAGVAEEKKGKEESVKEKKETEEDESSEEEEHQGILDKPLVVTGKRERKCTEFLVRSVAEPKKEVKALVFQGKGESLGSLERVNFELGKSTAFELKPLHRLLFGRDGRPTEIKKNLRQFNGFMFEKDSKEYDAKKQSIDRFTTQGLKRLCEILDVEKRGTRDEVLTRILEFLMSPVPSGKRLPQKKAKGNVKKRKKTASKKSKKSAKDDEEEDEEEEEDDDEEEEGDKEKEPPKKKAKKEKAAKEEKKKPSKRKEPVAVKIAPKKSPAKKTPKKEKKPVESDESSDEEPLASKAAKKQPTNKEIETLVKKLLEDANLEEVTMKSICKQVYDHYPSFDLTQKKDFIKETVKKVIS